MFPVNVCLRIESKRLLKKKHSASVLVRYRPIRVPDLPFSSGATKMVALFPMNKRYIRWYTPWLSRELEMLAFGNGGGLPLIIFPTSFGRYYQNKDFGLVGSASAFVDAGRVTVYCPDAIDLESFYHKSIHPADRMRTHNAYENVIVHGVFDLLDHGKWRDHDWNYWRDMPPYYLSVL
jgi:esterase/lipase superfamily enzyme